MAPTFRIPPWIALAACAWPSVCVMVGCDCTTVCIALGAGGCVFLAVIAGLALFVPLKFIEELQLSLQ